VLGDDALAIALADCSEEIHAFALDVIGVKQAFVSTGSNEALQSALPLGQWQSAEIFTIQSQQIEGIERCVLASQVRP
jgi:hypothetical protein